MVCKSRVILNATPRLQECGPICYGFLRKFKNVPGGDVCYYVCTSILATVELTNFNDFNAEHLEQE